MHRNTILWFLEDGKRRLKGGKVVWMGSITSSFHQVSVYTNQRPETGAACMTPGFGINKNMHSKGVQTLNLKCIIGSEWDIRPAI